ncbi:MULTISPECIES: thiamine diphosphokinase [Anaerolinea]|uniref:thiamine diphosphokinase n=1 Tax=Anaerolinea TaxID=233189 RepID=UPI002622CF07|nr:thiamine diphosphokinase [Anaerolinea thermophila]
MVSQRALIVVSGTSCQEDALRRFRQPDDVIIAVDGGAHHCLRLGWRPHVVIGDFDSLSPEYLQQFEQEGVLLLRYPPEKDETDLELALQYAVQRGYRHIRILCALGGRVDQTLANLFLLGLPVLKNLDVRLEDGEVEAFLIDSEAEWQGVPGETVSLIPLFGVAQGIWTEGLRYPLRGETLYPERSRGISNEMVDHQARVRLSQGVLLCIHFHSDTGGS